MLCDDVIEYSSDGHEGQRVHKKAISSMKAALRRACGVGNSYVTTPEGVRENRRVE